jgi:hypothetical protein
MDYVGRRLCSGIVSRRRPTTERAIGSFAVGHIGMMLEGLAVEGTR